MPCPQAEQQHADRMGPLSDCQSGMRAHLLAQDGGSVTAGNSSPITDGACALVLVSAAKAAELGCPVLAVVRGYGDANQDPEWFTTGAHARAPAVARRQTAYLNACNDRQAACWPNPVCSQTWFVRHVDKGVTAFRCWPSFLLQRLQRRPPRR